MSRNKKSAATEAASEEKSVATKGRTVTRPKRTIKEATVYVGPRLPGGKLGRFVAFREGVVPIYVQKLIDECPALKSLFVPVSKLAEVQLKLSQGESLEAARFEEVRKHFYKGAN